MRFAVQLIILIILAGCTDSGETEPSQRPDHRTDDGYQNPHLGPYDGNPFSFAYERLFGDHDWADHDDQIEAMDPNDYPVVELDPAVLATPGDVPRATWIGHATVLVQYNGVNVLTDPMFSDRASPVPLLGPERHFPPAVSIENLPPIHAVVISHNHYEHLDEDSIRALGNAPKYYVPLGLKEWFVDNGIDESRIVELDWWSAHDSMEKADTRVTATPSQHWSTRGLFDRNETLWASWHVQIGDFSMWFAGDTGYNDFQFREIGETLGPMNLAIIPIGAYEPREMMKVPHVNPDEAVKMHQDVRSELSIAMHWATFTLSAEDFMQPRHDLERARQHHGVSESEFLSPDIGGTLTID